MDGDKTFKIFVFLQKVFYSFGVFVMFVTLTTFFIPPAEQYTGMLSLAPAGLSVVSLLQFFLTALCCTILRSLFETNLIFKKMSFLWRTVFSVISIFITTSIMVVLFDWFPKNGQWMGWIGLAITFTTFTIGGIVVMILKTRYESKQYEKILHDFNDRKVEKNDE